MLRILRIVFLFFLTIPVLAQEGIVSRVILIGDAGEINPGQETIIPFAADQVLKEKTTVMFLGDNIYPWGMGLGCS